MRGNSSSNSEAMAPAKDYFQSLPDALVCRIFGEIGPLHKIAPCRLVCRRWRALFTGVDYLDFSCNDLMKKVKKDAKRIPLLESFIGRTIGATTCGVQELHITGPEFGVGAVCMWLRAVNHTLECLTLEEDGDGFVQIGNKLLEVFRCGLLKEVSLSYYQIDFVPPEATPLTRLTSITLNDVSITDAALECMIDLCPILNYLDLCDCSGLSSPYIRHNVLATIYLSFQDALTTFTLSHRGDKDPKVEVICVKWVKKLVVKAHGVGKIVVRSPCLITLPKSATVEKLVLESSEDDDWNLNDVTDAISGLGKTEIKSVSIPASLNKIEKVVPPRFFGCMSKWAGLEIGCDIFKCLRRCFHMEELPELPLKNVTIHMPWVDDKSLEVVNGLVRKCPMLARLSICVSDKSKGWKFADGLLRLQRDMKHVEITLQEDKEETTEEDEVKDENEDERNEDEEDDPEDDENEDDDDDDE